MEVLKITVLGNRNSGKTSLIDAILGEDFSPSHIGTMGVNKIYKKFDNLPICIMDTPDVGQSPIFKMGLDYRDTQICIICIDLSQKISFVKIKTLIESIDGANRPNNPIILLVGTKADLVNDSERQAKEEELKRQADDLKCQGCFMTSAKENTNIETVYSELETLIKQENDKKNTVAASSASKNSSRPNSYRLPSNNSLNNNTNKQESNQRISLVWQRHKHKIINGLIVGTFMIIAVTLALVFPVAPVLASIGLALAFKGVALTATLAGIGAAVGLVAGSVVAGITSGIEALVKLLQHKEKNQEKADKENDQSYYSKKQNSLSHPALKPSNRSTAKSVDLSQHFSSPTGILVVDKKQTGSNTTSKINQPKLSTSP